MVMVISNNTKLGNLQPKVLGLEVSQPWSCSPKLGAGNDTFKDEKVKMKGPQ